jgi:hypothetical protein
MLAAIGKVQLYTHDGGHFGFIHKFIDHQKIDHRTASRLPAPPEVVADSSEKTVDSASEPADITEESMLQGREGKGREQGKEQGGERGGERAPRAVLAVARPDGVGEQVWIDFVAHRKKIRAGITPTVLAGFQKAATAAGWTLEAAMAECVTQGWRGFRADWVRERRNGSASSPIKDLRRVDPNEFKGQETISGF